MKKTILAVTLSLVTGVAIAAESGHGNQGGNGGVRSESSSQANGTNIGYTGGNSMTNNFNSPGTVEYKGGYELKNVPAITAPNLTTTLTETCMGSSTVGGAGAGFGFSFGTTWRDTSCVNRLDARQIAALGDAQAAKEIMCESDSVRKAFRNVGRPCAGDTNTQAAGSIVTQPVAKVEEKQVPAEHYSNIVPSFH
jgi:hypothetical protein